MQKVITNILSTYSNEDNTLVAQ